MPITYDNIATTTLGSAAASFTFSSIPATYTDLKIVCSNITSAAGAVQLSWNSDQSSLYSATSIYGTGTTAVTQSFLNDSRVLIIGYVGGPSNTNPSFATIDLFNYAGSTFKTALIQQNVNYNGSGGVANNVSCYRSTNAISSILFYTNGANLNAGCTFTLYGVKNA